MGPATRYMLFSNLTVKLSLKIGCCKLFKKCADLHKNLFKKACQKFIFFMQYVSLKMSAPKFLLNELIIN